MTQCKKYATGAYVESRGHKDDTLGCGGLGFMKTRSGKPFNISRPAFRTGESNIARAAVPSLRPNNRRGLGNYDIQRNNFISPPIRGREVLNFERLQAQDISEGGIRVQLGDKTIEQLFKVKVADPTDIDWINEKNRRVAAGETEEQIAARPPLGRPQRTVAKRMNFGAQNLSMSEEIELLKAAVSQGSADNTKQSARIIADTALLLTNIDRLSQMSYTTSASLYNSLHELVKGIRVPQTWREMGLGHRFFSVAQYRKQAGMINLFLLSNIPEGRTFDKPIVSMNAAGGPSAGMSIISLDSSLRPGSEKDVSRRKPGKYLDVELRAVVPLSYVVEQVNNGVDDGKLNGQPSPPGGWRGDIIPIWDLTKQQQEDPNVLQKTQGGFTSAPPSLVPTSRTQSLPVGPSPSSIGVLNILQ